MVVALSLFSDKFLTFANQRNILLQISVNLCLSIGMTLIILTGGIDLSVGAITRTGGRDGGGLAEKRIRAEGVWRRAAIHAIRRDGRRHSRRPGTRLVQRHGHHALYSCPLRSVATLGMLSIARGLTMLWTGGFPITDLGPKFGFIGAGFWLGVPMAVWISAALVVIFYIMSKRTTLSAATSTRWAAARRRRRFPASL